MKKETFIGNWITLAKLKTQIKYICTANDIDISISNAEKIAEIYDPQIIIDKNENYDRFIKNLFIETKILFNEFPPILVQKQLAKTIWASLSVYFNKQ